MTDRYVIENSNGSARVLERDDEDGMYRIIAVGAAKDVAPALVNMVRLANRPISTLQGASEPAERKTGL